LLISLHRHDHGKFYPCRPDASSDHIGTGKGLGFNINIPWDTNISQVDEFAKENNTVSDLGSNEYKLAFESIVLPVAREFAPDVIIVSCGFDGGIGDQIGWCKLCPMMYFWMTNKLA